jgi:hypothetical protein
MIQALLLAVAVALANTGVSLAAKRWTGTVDRRWAKAQGAAIAVRVALFTAGMIAVWHWVSRPGPLVAYIFAAMVTQTALHAALWHKNKL